MSRETRVQTKPSALPAPLGAAAALLMIIPAAVADTIPAASCEQPDQPVEALSLPQPWYPHSASTYCLTGAVTVEFTIETDGTIRNIRIMDSEPDGLFETSVVQTIEKWRFSPACKDGETVPQTAIQTIEFELPPDSATSCRQNMSRLDEDAARLFEEVALRYALMAETHQGRFPGADLANELGQPLTGFTGDLGAVADLHGAVFNYMRSIIENSHNHAGLSAVMRDLHPVMLAQDDDLADLNASIDQLRQNISLFEETIAAFSQQLKADYRSIRNHGDLEESQLDLLVKPFLGNPEAKPDDNTPASYRHIINLAEQLADLLEENRGGWQVDGETLQFTNKARQSEWDKGNRALRDALSMQQERFSQGLQPFLDYID